LTKGHTALSVFSVDTVIVVAIAISQKNLCRMSNSVHIVNPGACLPPQYLHVCLKIVMLGGGDHCQVIV